MKLQILIPQYDEPDSIVKPLLDSIEIQQRISFDDLSVIICNDGSNVFLSEDLLRSYSYKIEYHKEPHRGISGTRNALIDYATAEYIMFCDADDMFFNVYGIMYIMKEIDKKPFDFYYSCFHEEYLQDGKFTYVLHENEDTTFIHGKVFKRQFLIEEDIRFCEELIVHEDVTFCAMAKYSTENTRYCPTPFYVWKWRDDSVCRRDPEYIFKTDTIITNGNDIVVDRLLKRDNVFMARSFVASYLIDEYYDLNKPKWHTPENEKFLYEAEKRTGEYYLKYKSLWDEVSVEDRTSISEVFRAKKIKEGMLIEDITLNEWLCHIEKLAKEGENGETSVPHPSVQRT